MDELYGWIVVIVVIIGFTVALKAGKHIRQNANPERRNVNVPNNGFSNETGPMIYFANNRHGRRDYEYRFNYKNMGTTWRAYILRMPSLENRDAGGAVTHRLYDNGRPYVCWDHQVKSLKDMQTISKRWADCIQEYIATGKRFG